MYYKHLLLAGLFFLFAHFLKIDNAAYAQCSLQSGTTYMVTTGNGTGPGSLPYIINQVNSAGVPANIRFSINPIPPATATVSLFASLPVIVPAVTILGKNMSNNMNIPIYGYGLPAPCFRFSNSSSCFDNLTLIGFVAVNYVVTNINDSGAGSFRQGLSDVSASGIAGTISFNIPGTPPHTIVPLSPFPVMKSPATIDATTQPANGYSGGCSKIILDGSSIASSFAPVGISIEAANSCKIYGFTIKNFTTGIQVKNNSSSFPVKYGGSNFVIGSATGRNILISNSMSGITILGTKNGIIENNYVGLDCDGTIAANGDGIVLSGDTSATTKNNVVSGNTDSGITLVNSKGNKITGNFIGTDPTGTSSRGNLGTGVECIGAYVTIGGTGAGEGNVISGNGASGSFEAGIMITSGWGRIVANKIGTNTSGTASIPNQCGIINNGNPKALYIGGASTAERNIISGNSTGGLHIRAAVDTIYIKGNYIGLAIDGNTPLSNNMTPLNYESGLYIRDEAKIILVGGTTAAEANIISGNSAATGIEVGKGFNSVANVKFEILGNVVGLNASGNTAVPNRNGIYMGETNYPVTLKNNISSGNTVNGLTIQGYNHVVKGNKIGTNAAATLNLGNGSMGIFVSDPSQGLVIGGTTAGDANLICNNGSYGIGMNYYSPTYPNHYNYFSRNSFYNNGNKGIEQKVVSNFLPANDAYEKPVIKYASSNTIRGTAAPNSTVDLYQNHTFNTFPQGQTFVASAATNALGEWTYVNASISNPYNIIALAYSPVNFNNSEFSDKYNYTNWTAGASTNNWFDAGNWSNGIPDCNKSAIINTASIYPVLNTGAIAAVYNIDINSGTQLTISPANTLNVCGSWLNNGTISSVGAGTVVLQGNEKQYLSGTVSTTFGKLTANNTGPLNKGIIMNTSMAVASELTLSQGIISTGAYILYLSNNAGASLTTFSNTSFINGTLNRKITNNTDTYSFPVGKGTSSSDYYRVDILNNNLTGVPDIRVFVTPIIETGNNVDARLGVTELSLPYSNIRELAVWDITPSFSPTGGSYGVRLFTENFPGLTDNTFAPLKRSGTTNYMDWTNSIATVIPAENTPGRTVADGYAERTGYTSFSQHAIAEAIIGLPVNFLNLQAFPNHNNTIQVNWFTSDEIELDYFIVERSGNGSVFLPLDTIYSLHNSLPIHEYSYVDSSPLPKNYYRIRQIDINKTYAYSKIIAVTPSENTTALTVNPNPSSSFIEIVFSQITRERTVEVKLLNASGIEYAYPAVATSEGILQLALASSLPSGYYTILIIDDSKVYRAKFIKQ